MLSMVCVILGLGANLGQPEAAFARALELLSDGGCIQAVSRLWRTVPVGPSQPDFLNAAVMIEWPAGLWNLLARCRDIESLAGRDRSREERWGPRTLDIDLLIAASVVCRGPSLELPHPRFHERRFALDPAAEIAPHWVHQVLGRSLLELCEEARDREPDAILDVSDFKLAFLDY